MLTALITIIITILCIGFGVLVCVLIPLLGIGIIGIILSFSIVVFIIGLIATIIITAIQRVKCFLGFHDISEDNIIIKDGRKYVNCNCCHKSLIYDDYDHKWRECIK